MTVCTVDIIVGIPIDEKIENNNTTPYYWSKLFRGSKTIINEEEKNPVEINKKLSDYLLSVSSITQQLREGEISVVPVVMDEGKISCTEQYKDLVENYNIDLTNLLDLQISTSLILWGFHCLNRRDFVESLMRYGIFYHNWKEFYNRCLRDSINSLKEKTFPELELYAQHFTEELNNLVTKKNYDQIIILTAPYTAKQIITRISDIDRKSVV